MENTHDTPSGRTCRARYQVIRDGTSSPSSVRSSKPPVATELMYLNLGGGVRQENLFGETPVASWEKVIRLPGECWTPNTGESPSVVRESTLSQILEDNAPEKYFLSARACEGILRRAEKRGKKLPLMLWEALVETVERSICDKILSPGE